MITRNGISVRAWTAPNGDRLVEIGGEEIQRLDAGQRQAFVDHLQATLETSVSYAYGAGRVPAPRPGRSVVTR